MTFTPDLGINILAVEVLSHPASNAAIRPPLMAPAGSPKLRDNNNSLAQYVWTQDDASTANYLINLHFT